MSTNTELIADLQSNIVGDPFPLMRKAADAIEALEAELKNVKAVATNNSFSMLIAQRERDALQAEVDRLTTLAHGQHIELYNARLQLAAAQGQEPVAWQCKEIGGSFWQECAKERGLVRAARPEKWEVRPLYAAPIPQQVAEPAPSSLPLLSEAFRTTESNGASSDYRMVFKFKDLASLHSADDEWRKFKGAA